MPPQASFTVTCTGLTCIFDGSDSADPDGSIASYAWDFGDGASGSRKAVSHTYGRAGSYTVTDNASATGSDAKAVNPIGLSVRGYKQNGLQRIDLSWSGSSAGELRRLPRRGQDRDRPGKYLHGQHQQERPASLHVSGLRTHDIELLERGDGQLLMFVAWSEGCATKGLMGNPCGHRWRPWAACCPIGQPKYHGLRRERLTLQARSVREFARSLRPKAAAIQGGPARQDGGSAGRQKII
jgi:hypothetical protein